MKVRERLKLLKDRFFSWISAHRRGLLLASWFLFMTFLGAGYYFLAQYYSLPTLSPLGINSGASPEEYLSEPIAAEISAPITGTFFSAKDAEFWQGNRPLAVMIDNHELARPYQFGLQKANVIYEAVAEGGITRFLAVFHDQSVAKLGPVRSARVYYIDWALEFPAYYGHVGGASTPGEANIHTHIAVHNVLDLDQFRLGASTYTYGGDVHFRGGAVLSHINYTTTSKLWNAGEALYRGSNKLPNFAQWQFKAEEPYLSRPASQKITFRFWSFPAAYAGEWRYNPVANSYLRFQGGAKHIDQATKKQLFAKNVVLVYMSERPARDGTSHRIYTTTGQGNADVYLDGRKISATWKRTSLSSRMKFYKRGTTEEVAFNRGLTWIEVIPQ